MPIETDEFRASVPCADINWQQCLKDPGFWLVVGVFILLLPLALMPVRGTNPPKNWRRDDDE